MINLLQFVAQAAIYQFCMKSLTLGPEVLLCALCGSSGFFGAGGRKRKRVISHPA